MQWRFNCSAIQTLSLLALLQAKRHFAATRNQHLDILHLLEEGSEQQEGEIEGQQAGPDEVAAAAPAAENAEVLSRAILDELEQLEWGDEGGTCTCLLVCCKARHTQCSLPQPRLCNSPSSHAGPTAIQRMVVELRKRGLGSDPAGGGQ